MIVFLDGLFGISFSVSQALRTLMGEIIALIFSFIEYLYDIFIYLAKAQILSNDFIESIYRKVGMILGIFMVFKLSFTLINSLITPSKLNDKKSGFAAIIFRSVIAIVLFGITPSIFKEAYNLQNLIIGGGTTDNIIYKLVANQDSNINLNDLGRKLSSNLYFSFYTDNENPKLDQGISDDPLVCNSDDQTEDEKVYCDRFRGDNFKTLVSNVEAGDRSFYDTVPYLAIEYTDTKSGNSEYVIEYNWLLLLIVGVLTVWMLVMYCIQVGVRVIQLGYLQLIAPIPILSYIAEPEGSFKKWLNQCVSTFLDLFIRLAIIYFVMTTIGTIIEQFNNASGIIFESTGIPANESFTLALVKIFIILGLLLFAKKVPDLLKEVFPSLGGAGKFSFSLKPPKEAKGFATFGLGTAAGAVGGLVTGIKYGDGLRGKFTGAFAGLGRGAVGGMKTKGNPFTNAGKGMASQRTAAIKAYERNHDGSDFWGRTIGSHEASLIKAAFDKELKAYSDYDSYVEFIEKELEKNSLVQIANAQKQALLDRARNGGPPPTMDEIKRADLRIKNARKTALQFEIHNGNDTITRALTNADAIRQKGYDNGYAGFSNDSLIDGNDIARVNAFFDNKKSAKNETANIKDVSGSRNKEYKSAEANAKYDKTK